MIPSPNRSRTVAITCSIVLVALAAGRAPAQQPVLAGLDLLETDATQTFEDLSSLDLLCPGCFVIGNPVIPLRGIPLEESPACPGANLGDTDTIVRRLNDTPIMFPGNNEQVDIELVELHLQSVQPFQVDCSGDLQLWMLDVTIDPAQPQNQGQMLIQKTHANGGFFDAMLPVRPILTFTRVDDCPPAIVCEGPGREIIFDVQGAPWSHNAPYPVLDVPGCTSNFVPGVHTGPDPGLAIGGGFVMASLFDASTRGYRRTLPAKLTQNTWQDAVHFTFDLFNSGGKGAVPAVDALRLFNPRWIPNDPPGALPDSSVYFKSNSICNLDPLWTLAPTSWCRVNWDSTDANYRDEAWWFFGSVAEGELAPGMDVVFSFPTSDVCPIPSPAAWYEVDYECYFACDPVEFGTFRFHCDPLPGAPVSAPPSNTLLRVGNVLEQNFPNPFRPETTIRYSLERAGPVKLTIYNIQGAVVRVLENGHRETGTHDVSWDGRDAAGRRVAAGAYFYEIQAGSVREARKMIRVN